MCLRMLLLWSACKVRTVEALGHAGVHCSLLLAWTVEASIHVGTAVCRSMNSSGLRGRVFPRLQHGCWPLLNRGRSLLLGSLKSCMSECMRLL